MNFDFSDEQKMIGEQADRFLSENSEISRLRQLSDEHFAFDREMWSAIADMGWLGVAIPEAYGGSGLGEMELCILAHRIGRALAPVPFISTCLVAEIIKIAGTDDQRARYLPLLAGGERIAALAFAEPGCGTPWSPIATMLRDGILNGTKRPVAEGPAADIALVSAKSDDAGTTGRVLCIVDLAADGVDRRDIAVFDQVRRHSEISFSGVDAEVLGDAVAYDRAMHCMAVLTAFEQIGGAESCLDMARAYALERHTFGRPIGSYQAIKHRLADMYVLIELARSNAYFAAWALVGDKPELAVAAATARISATEAFEFASRENLHIHGGVGYTWEADCHFFLRRSRLLALSLGSGKFWSTRLVELLRHQKAAITGQ